jgi:hypothetical protein
MKEFQQLRDAAKKRLKTADHLLNVTYKNVDEPKLLVNILEHTYGAYEDAMNSLLSYHELFKQVDVLPDDFEQRFAVFKDDVAPTYDMEHTDNVARLRGILAAHEESPVEFPRDGKFVICDEEYDVEELTEEKLKSFIEQGKSFVKHVEDIVHEHEGIFG